MVLILRQQRPAPDTISIFNDSTLNGPAHGKHSTGSTVKCRTRPQLDYLSYRGKPPIQLPSLTLGFHVLWFGEDGTKTGSAFDSSLKFTAVTHSAISHSYIFSKIPPTLAPKSLFTHTVMATRRLFTTSIIGRGRVPSSFRYSNHLKSFRIPHSTLAASSGPSVPSGVERTVSIQLVLHSVLPEVSHPTEIST